MLGKIGRLDLLWHGSQRCLIPEAVAAEILHGPPQDPARREIETNWVSKATAVVPDLEVVEWGHGPGETAVLSLARAQTAVAVVDDRAARIVCRTLGIRCIGTLGVILLAYRQGRIPSAIEILKSLKQAGLHLNDEVIRTTLQQVTGESWPIE